MNTKTRNVTLTDIALRAGVSKVTVSRALNSNYPVAEHTRERILAAMQELNYEPDGAAYRLQADRRNGHRRTGHVGLVLGDVPDRFADPFWASVLDGAKQEVLRHGYHLRFAFTQDDLKHRHQQRLLAPAHIDGLILAGSTARPVEHGIAPHYVAMVECGITWPLQADQITLEKRTAMHAMVDHLLELGHRRFTYLGFLGEEREVGVRERLQHQGLPADAYSAIEAAWGIQEAQEASTAFLRAHAGTLDAILCLSDSVAVGVIRAARALGMRVPEDIAVTGFNDMAFAADIDPPLTTIHAPKELLGALAVRKILEHFQYPDLPAVLQIVPTHLVVRRSSGSPRAQ